MHSRVSKSRRTLAQTITSYEYDSVGNRLSMTTGTDTTEEDDEDVDVQEYTYNGFNQLVQSNVRGQVTSYQYDAKGNQIKETTGSKVIAYTYSVTGEMINATRTSSTTTLYEQENEYNHEGVRISRTEDGVTRNYYYDNGSIAYTTDSGTLSSANILGSYQNVIGSYRGDDYYVYNKDVLGSTSSITKGDGSAAAVYDYSDFGEVTYSYDLIGNEICYTGAVYDETTGLHYMNSRYYDPASGRFISQDTYRAVVDDPGLWHLYVYCANNPINYVDPSGHKATYIGYGVQFQLGFGAFIKAPAITLDFIWFNRNLKERYENKSLHAYISVGAGFGSYDQNIVIDGIKKNPNALISSTSLGSLAGTVGKKLGKTVSITVAFMAIWANVKKFDSHEDYEGKGSDFSVAFKHVSFSLNWSKCHIALAGGISTGSFGVSIGNSYTWFSKKLTSGTRKNLSSVSSSIERKVV